MIDENKKIKKEQKNKKKLIISLMIISLLLIITGVTYAAFEYNFLGNKNVISTGTVSIEFLESTDVISLSNALPISDKQGKEQTDTFDFSVTTKANGDVNLKYNLMIEKLTVDTGYTSFNDNEIKVYLTDYNNNTLVEPTLISNLNNTLYSKTNTHSKTITEIKDKYKLRVWIDKDVLVENWDTIHYQYKFKIGVKTDNNLDTSGANTPVLSANMIPVYYDEACDSNAGCWKKADSENANKVHKWYNYDEKMWANSVTVTEDGYEKIINSDKTVNISDTIEQVTTFTSNNKNIDNSTSESEIIIETGETTGKLSFDYSVSSETNYDKLTLKINDQTIANGISGENTGTYEIEASANTTYKIIATYKKDNSTSRNNDEATLSNFVLPSGAKVTTSSSSSYPWKISNNGTSNKFSMLTNIVGTSYYLNQETGEFELRNITNEHISTDVENKYICADITEERCSTMYKVTSASDKITKVDEYTSNFLEKREIYKSAKPGTKIPMEDILTMQVWIPRYKYKVWNYNLSGTVGSDPQEIQIEFEKGISTTGNITCVDNVQGTSDGTTSGTEPTVSEVCKVNNIECTDELCNNKTYTHPAFTFGDKQLTGIWVGKFEVSSDVSCEIGVVVSMNSGCNLSKIRPLVKPNVTSWRGAMVSIFEHNMMAMNDSNNKYGFETTDDTHMIKNIEWGSVVYLSHSKYGKNKYIAVNKDQEYTTGCGTTTSCSAYNTSSGKSTSTTGNIYGIYDMSGGANEYTMANIVSPDGKTMISGEKTGLSYHSGFDGILYDDGNYISYDGSYSYPDDKYIDKYSFSESNSTKSRSKLGDGIKEVADRSYVWYTNVSTFAHGRWPWFARGSTKNTSYPSGMFDFGAEKGDGRKLTSSRLVITQ